MRHKNNFGFLRLFFATLVIVSHSAEIIDGNRSRELLTNLFGTLSFGEIAVDAFFLISGFLITKSYENSTTTTDYLMKRIRRIYPGFIVAFLFSVFVVGPLVGAQFTPWSIALALKDIVTLSSPSIPGFIGLHYADLNGSLWSIAVEFRCYLFVIVFATLGLLRKKWMMVALTACLLVAMETKYQFWVPRLAAWVLGDPSILIRMLGIFCVGSLFYLFRENMLYENKIAMASAILLLFSMSRPIVSEAAFAILGGYLIFWAALHLESYITQHINSSDDISYGVYLYAWPIQSALVYFLHFNSPTLLTSISIPIVYGIGFVSWQLVEKRFVRIKSTPLVIRSPDSII